MSSTLPENTADNLPDNVLVFGASGFIGSNLLHRLRGRVGRLVGLSQHGFQEQGVETLTMAQLPELTLEGETVAVVLAAHRYDASAFKLAQSEILVRNVNILGEAYHACVRLGVQEVRLASSIGVYGGELKMLEDGAPLDRGLDPAQSELMYGWSKRIGETYARLYRQQYDINTIAFRLSNPYGPRDSLDEEKAHVVPAFVMRALTGEGPFGVRGSPSATRDFVFVDDVCGIFERSLKWRGRQEVYNLGSGEDTSIATLARTVLDLVGTDRELVTQGEATSSVQHRSLRVDRIKKDFSLQAFTSLRAGLESTIAWYRDALQR